MRLIPLSAAAAFALAAPFASAEDKPMDHSAHGAAEHAAHAQAHHGAAPSAPSAEAFEAANAAMHKDMAIAYTGDADVDFLAGMIPHHQGAVAMAYILLEHGDDPEVKRLAEEIIKAQEKEIAWMKAHLAKISKKPE